MRCAGNHGQLRIRDGPEQRGGVLDGHEVVVAHDYESGRRDPTEVVDGDVRLALQHLRELAEEEKRRTSAGASSVCCAN